MSEYQIVTSYRDAKHPTKQIGVLAQLNGCSTATIKMILYKHGIITSQAPKSYGKDRFTSDQLRKARMVRREGRTYREIAECTNATIGSVRYYLNKFIT